MDVSVLTTLVMILVLAGMVGYFVVWGVTPALHTPLMAVTNAISGIVVVAAMLVAGSEIVGNGACSLMPCAHGDSMVAMQWAARVLGAFAVALCAVNIFGGFMITRRMLAMFKRKGEK